MNVYRISLKVGFDCNPHMEIANENCEQMPDGKILPVGEKNAKTALQFEEARIVLKDNFDSPGVEVYCYVKDIREMADDEISKCARKLYENGIQTMQWLSRVFSERVDKIAIPSAGEIVNEVRKIGANGRTDKQWIGKEEVLKLLSEKTKNRADELIVGKNLPVETLSKWSGFCKEHLSDALFQKQIESVHSVESFEDKYGFSSQEAYDAALASLPEVTARDLIMLFENEAK